MTFEEKRNNLIHAVKVLVIVTVSIASVVVGIVVWLSASKEQKEQYKQKVSSLKGKLKRAFGRFASGR